MQSRIKSSKEKLVCALILEIFDQYYRSQNLILALLLPASASHNFIYMLKLKWFDQKEGVNTAGVEQSYMVKEEVGMCINIEAFWSILLITKSNPCPPFTSSHLPQVRLHAQAKIVWEQEEGVTAGAKEDYIIKGEVGMCTKIEEFWSILLITKFNTCPPSALVPPPTTASTCSI